MRIDAEEMAKRITDEARQKGEDYARRITSGAEQKGSQIIAEAEHKAIQVVEEAKSKESAKTIKIVSGGAQNTQSDNGDDGKAGNVRQTEEASMSELFEGIVELALAPPVPVRSLLLLHAQLKHTPNIDVLNVKGSVDEGITVRMIIRNPVPLLELIKKIALVRNASDADSFVQSQVEEGIKRIVLTSC